MSLQKSLFSHIDSSSVGNVVAASNPLSYMDILILSFYKEDPMLGSVAIQSNAYGASKISVKSLCC